MKNKLFISLLPIETERLIIKSSSIKDIDLILKMDNQETTQAYLGNIKTKSREERILFLKKKEDKDKKGYASSLTVYLKDRTPIGFLELSINEINNKGKISYIFDADYCNKGYCTEACKELLNIGFNKLNLNKIIADTIEGNNSSKRVLEKLGFKIEGIRRKTAHIESTNEYKVFLDYVILKKEYK